MHWNHQHWTKRFYRSHQDNLNWTPLSSAPRQSVTLWRIMEVHQSTDVNDPPCPRHQKHKTQTNIVINWYHHPHGQEAEVYSTSCNSCQEENEPSRFFCNPSLYYFFRYVKSLSSWKPSLVSWWHVLKSNTHFVFGFVIYSNMWRLLLFNLFPSNCLSYLQCISCT
jgi:hypothetical protein